MAFRAAIRLSRKQQCTTYGRININSQLLSEKLPTISQGRKYHNGNNNDDHESKGSWSGTLRFGAGSGVAAAIAVIGFPAHELNAEENNDKKVIEKESRWVQ